jgi:putative sugar O-methyltransferase
MIPVNYIKKTDSTSQEARATAAVEMLKEIENYDLPDPTMRSDSWKHLHGQMLAAIDIDALLQFQSHPEIAPQICGGGGDVYLDKITERFGQETLSFLLSTYRETLCGDPQDIVCAKGCYLTKTAMRHIYHLAYIRYIVSEYFRKKMNVVEIGGGFGNLARLCRQYNLTNRYFLVDYPAVLCIQFYFLTEFFSPDSIALWNGDKFVHGDQNCQFCLVTPNAAKSIMTMMATSPLGLVSTMAITEMPQLGQLYYLENIFPDFIYVFGQLETTALPQGIFHEDFNFIRNKGLFEYLCGEYHTIDYTQSDYYGEYLGIKP